jgi:NHL repeat
MKTRKVTLAGLAGALVVSAMLVFAAGAMARTEFVLVSRFGGEVDVTTPGNVCPVNPGDTCQNGIEGTSPGAFKGVGGVAVNQETEDVYVGDRENNRVQEFTAAGQFIRMFGWEVNETTPGNVCPINPGDVCKAGEPGAGAGQISDPMAVAVDNTCYDQKLSVSECAADDPSNGDVYVQDKNNHRIDKYSPTGQFILTFGGEVDETTPGNVCPVNPGDVCRAGSEGTAPSFFTAWLLQGSMTTVGSNDVGGTVETTVYVGDRTRVQKFTTGGVWFGELSLSSISPTERTRAVVADAAGDVYVKVNEVSGVREFNAAGVEQSTQFGGTEVTPVGLAPSGDIAVVEWPEGEPLPHGILYKPTGAVASEFGYGVLKTTVALTFNDTYGELYAADTGNQDVEVFKAVVFAEAFTTTSPAPVAQATTVTLTGEVNPESGPDTTSSFEYGLCEASCATSPYGQEATAVRSADPGKGSTDDGTGSANVAVEAQVTGLQPHKTYHYRLVAHNINGPSPGAEGTFETRAVAPVVVSEPASFVRPDGATMNGALNPENSDTQYQFEYGPCEPASACSTSIYTNTTVPVDAGEGIGAAAVFGESTELRPSTTYHYRLIASNNKGEKGTGDEQTFTTAPAPLPVGVTGPASSVTQTAATISGTVLNPDARPGTYGFRIGTEAGKYGPTIGFGSVGAGVEVTVAFSLLNVQPGATYHYRIVAANRYGVSEGADETFTTPGVASPLSLPIAPPLLATPAIAFPKEPAKVTPKKLTRAQQLARALKACAKQPKSKRAACRRSARKKYAASKRKGKK